MRHSALPVAVEQAVAALPQDAHPMSVLLVGLAALSACHPEANPALAGQNVYKAREVQDKQVRPAWAARVGTLPAFCLLNFKKGVGGCLPRAPLPGRWAVRVGTAQCGHSGCHTYELFYQ